MTKLKDKLSASVRQAKASQQPAAKKPDARTAGKAAPIKAPAVAVHAKAPPPKPAWAPARETPPGSGSVLFPDRVWPD